MCPYCRDETQYRDFKKDIRPNLMLCQWIEIIAKIQAGEEKIRKRQAKMAAVRKI